MITFKELRKLNEAKLFKDEKGPKKTPGSEVSGTSADVPEVKKPALDAKIKVKVVKKSYAGT